MVRTRFAPSPTGYLHIGGARTALFSWAYARRHGGQFILRIEDTDLDRSTIESKQAILDGMEWLGLDYDEGPYYQMQRMARYQEVAEQLLNADLAYYCYASKEELEELRTKQLAAGLKPRYDGRWRDSKKTPPSDVKPVIRFKNPLSGYTGFDDLIKGHISVANQELDDLVLVRSDGVPTYNFSVVLDDLDMNISHVIRGDDHVNNTPRQINILKALDAPLPEYAHVPMILGSNGERLSKRHGAVSVTQYRDDGYLPDAMINYLARLGWSHGDEEIFNREQLISWFDFGAVNHAPAKFNTEKLSWLNQQYLKETDNEQLKQLAIPFLEKQNGEIKCEVDLLQIIALLKERVNTIEELASAAHYFFQTTSPSEELKAQHFNSEVKPILAEIITQFAEIEWNRETIHTTIKAIVKNHGAKFGKVAMPLRVMVTGETHTPSIDAVLALLGKEETLRRMQEQINSFPP